MLRLCLWSHPWGSMAAAGTPRSAVRLWLIAAAPTLFCERLQVLLPGLFVGSLLSKPGVSDPAHRAALPLPACSGRSFSQSREPQSPKCGCSGFALSTMAQAGPERCRNVCAPQAGPRGCCAPTLGRGSRSEGANLAVGFGSWALAEDPAGTLRETWDP